MGFDAPLLGPLATLLVNEVWRPIKKHTGFCLKPATHMNNLIKAANVLENQKENLKDRIEVGKREGKRPTELVTNWVKSAESVCKESKEIKDKYNARSRHALGCSWNCLFNYRVSKAAAKKKKAIDDVKQITPQDDSIFSLLPPIGRELPLPPNIVEKKEHMDKILGYIEQGTLSIIGIWGPARSGKTTLLKQLNNIFCCSAEIQEFDHVIYVEVGRQQNLTKIQGNIASQLGLKLGHNEDTLARSVCLHDFLKGRRFLLLIDDLWETLALESVGIPQGKRQIGPKNRQMIVITTRQQEVCHRMKVHHDHMILLGRPGFNEAQSPSEADAVHNSQSLVPYDSDGVRNPEQATTINILARLHLSPQVMIIPVTIQLQPPHAAAIFHGGVNPFKLALDNDGITEFQPSSLQKTHALSLPCYSLTAGGGMISGGTTASPSIVFDVLPAPDGRTIQLHPATYCNPPLSLAPPGETTTFFLPQLSQLLAGTQFTYLPPWPTATAPQRGYAFAPPMRTGSSTVVLKEIVENENERPAVPATQKLQLFPPSPDLNKTDGPAQVVADLNGLADTTHAMEGPSLPDLNNLPAVQCR
ncbi:hypothetical protein ACP4OV_003867 [Aristida adscensionis]